jgi:hypothetical protein
MFKGKAQFDMFRMEVEQALQEVAKKYDINIKSGKIKYNENSLEMDLKASKKEVNGKSFDQSEFEKVAFMYGFKPEDFGRQFNMSGKTFTLYGFKSSARTMPVLAKGNDGKNYKFGTEVARLLI